MKKLMPGVVALAVIGASSALAADLPAKVYTKAPAVAQLYDWTGFYLGGELGGGWSRSYGSYVFPPPATYANSNSTGIGGGFAGYQYQWNKVVLGIEANVVALFNSDLGSSSCTPLAGCIPGLLVGNTLGSAIWSVGPRLGWAAGVWMPYVTGGYAGTRLSNALNFGVDAPFSQNRSGWYVGGGIDWAINTNWIIGVEYRHYDFGTSRTVPTLLGIGAPNPADTVDIDLKSDTVAARLSYKFGGPVVAKY